MPRARALAAAACRRAVPLFAAPSVITQPSIVPRAAQYCAEGLPWGCFVLSEAMNTHARLSILAALLLLASLAPTHAGAESRLAWANEHEGRNRSAFDQAAGRRDTAMQFESGCPPLRERFGNVVVRRAARGMLQNASAPDVWELDYDARFAAPAAFYTRAHHDVSAFVLSYWRGAMEEAAAEYSRFWSRSAGAMRAYVAAKTECEPWPQALKSLEWEQTAVVHFRCSDVPFISAPYAHLQSLQYAEWAGEQLAKRGVRQVSGSTMSTSSVSS